MILPNLMGFKFKLAVNHQQTLEHTMDTMDHYCRHIVVHSIHSAIANPLLLCSTAIVPHSTTIADHSYGSMCRVLTCGCCEATGRYRGHYIWATTTGPIFVTFKTIDVNK